jgi:starch synthase (maltosyl-transferring)
MDETRLTRVVINGVRPTTPDGVSDAKAVVGRPVVVSANIFADGHDELAGQLRWRRRRAKTWQVVPMRPLDNDRWEGEVVPAGVGGHEFVVVGWVDLWATWAHRVRAKIGAGQDVASELEEGARLLEHTARLDGAARLGAAAPPDAGDFAAAIGALRSSDPSPASDAELAGRLASIATTEPAASAPQPVWVDRQRAAVGAWYELFPRSYGGLAGTAKRLTAVAAMGFDVAYLPPIHPIGTTARKGPGNVLSGGRGDPGSPWAIGSPAGGHAAVHPELGTLDEFDDLVAEASRLGMEVSLDLAYQCSPDHPWVKEHPEWFHHRPDGTIRFAENPPKQYQDIYPINFLPSRDQDRLALWAACRDVVEFWIGHGVKIFRVDNPHTKPFSFWRWMLADVRRAHPETVFLAEAFTRPRVMERLAEIGFSQSYTYFTWRNTRDELASYGEELAHSPASDYFRPNLWTNTPDILSGPLRGGALGAFKMRAALAATLGPSWGVYSGFELGENVPASDTNEEYAHSEKYELVERDWDAPWSLVPYLTRLNDIRARHPALADLRSLRFHSATDDQLLVYSKQCSGQGSQPEAVDTVLVVVNLDPAATHEATLWVDLGMLGLPWDSPLVAHDEITGLAFPWQGPQPYVRLTPDEPAHVIDLKGAP